MPLSLFIMSPSGSGVSHFRVTSDAGDVQNIEGNWTEENRHEAHGCVG